MQALKATIILTNHLISYIFLLLSGGSLPPIEAVRPNVHETAAVSHDEKNRRPAIRWLGFRSESTCRHPRSSCQTPADPLLINPGRRPSSEILQTVSLILFMSAQCEDLYRLHCAGQGLSGLGGFKIQRRRMHALQAPLTPIGPTATCGAITVGSSGCPSGGSIPPAAVSPFQANSRRTAQPSYH